jgi:hypothetical protein
MQRRDFLRATAAGGASAALGATVWTKRASAVPFGEVPVQHASSMLPESARAQSILECFLYGGLIPLGNVSIASQSSAQPTRLGRTRTTPS